MPFHLLAEFHLPSYLQMPSYDLRMYGKVGLCAAQAHAGHTRVMLESCLEGPLHRKPLKREVKKTHPLPPFQVMLVIYAVLAIVLLLNLLIAIVSFR